MDKEKILNELKWALGNGLVSKTEVSNITGETNTTANIPSTSVVRRLGISEIFYLIGGIIVLIGLIILVAQNWVTMSYGVKVLTTLGVGIAFFVGAVALTQTKVLGKLNDIFFVLSAILMAIGYFVTFERFIKPTNINVFLILVPFLLLLQFGITQFITKKNVFTLFNAVFGTWLFFSLTNTMISNSNNNFGINFHLYRVILVGISYLFFGYYLQMKQRPFTSYFDGFGVLGILGASFALNIMTGTRSFLSGGAPQAPAIWSVLFPLILIAVLFGSVYLKKTSFLTFGTLFLVAYLIRITAQYFSDITGWPIALIFMGIVVMGLGYLAIYVNKKYIKSSMV